MSGHDHQVEWDPSPYMVDDRRAWTAGRCAICGLAFMRWDPLTGPLSPFRKEVTAPQPPTPSAS